MARRRPDHYAALGITAAADADAIKKAWRQRAFALHPDRTPKAASTEERKRRATAFLVAKDAYEVLGDPAKRAEYDAHRRIFRVTRSPAGGGHAAPTAGGGGFANATNGGHIASGCSAANGGRGGIYAGPVPRTAAEAEAQRFATEETVRLERERMALEAARRIQDAVAAQAAMERQRTAQIRFARQLRNRVAAALLRAVKPSSGVGAWAAEVVAGTLDRLGDD